MELDNDIVTNYGDVTNIGKRFLAVVAANRAAFYAITQNQNTWGLATTQSKLNVIDNIWLRAFAIMKDQDNKAFLGL